MRAKKDKTIAGQPVKKIAELLRLGGEGSWGPGLAAGALGMEESRADEVLAAMEQEGYLRRSPRADALVGWETTAKGQRLAASAATAQPILRSTADHLVEEFLRRARKVNDDPYYLYRVNKVVVFGGYLGKKPKIGAIDIAVSLSSKESDPVRRRAMEKARVEEAKQNCRRFASYMEELFWPYYEVILYLKSRSRSIELHSVDLERKTIDNLPAKKEYAF